MDTKKLRQKILDLAIHGKLVPQDPNDEPASVLLERIRAEKEQLIKEGKIKKSRKTSSSSDTPHYEQVPFEVPQGWVWTTGNDIFMPLKSCIPQGDVFMYVDIDAIDNKRNIITNPKRIPTKHAPSRATRFIQAGDTLFSMVRPYLRNIACVPQNGWIASTGFYVCSPTKLITQEYCYYLMLSDYVVNGLNQFMKGDNSPSINNGHITSWLYPVPPLEEQSRIVEEIEHWFTLVDLIEQGKANLDNTIQKAKNKILDLAIHGRLVPQDPNDEPAIELLKRTNPSFIPCDNAQYGNLPNGWLIVDFNSIFETISSKPYQIKQSQIQSHGIRPVVSQSMNHIEGYTDEANYLHHQSPVLVFGDHTRIVKYIDFDFVVGADGVKIINPLFYQRYAYYMILYASINIEDKGYSRHFCQIAKFTYCLPPLKEQIRIVAQIEELYAQLDKIESSLQA